MSEYQYYEFQALDRPLTDAQMKELRKYSSRAKITPSSFMNVYNWGSFKGDQRQWMEKYFDASLYVANWGSHRLDFRVPKRLLDSEVLSEYCTAESLAHRAKGDYVIVSFASEDESGEWEEGGGWLASLTPLRADLMNGDHRSLYLGWLVAAQEGYLEDDEIEPPAPPGLKTLSAPLRRLADFLRIDADWLEVAGEGSVPATAVAPTEDEIADWVGKMPLVDKDLVISTLIRGDDPHFAVGVRQRVVREIRNAKGPGGESGRQRRCVGELRACAATIADERRKREVEARARAKAKRERERAEARKRHLESLLGKEETLWHKVDALIARKQPKPYDEAVALLQDLRDLADRDGQRAAFSARMEKLCLEHTRRPALIDRFRKANLLE